MKVEDLPVGPSPHDWANAQLKLTKLETANREGLIYELRKTIDLNGVQHVQVIWVTPQQLRTMVIDHGE